MIRRRIPLASALAITLSLAPAPAAGRPVVGHGCRAEVPDNWTTSGNGSSSPDGRVQVVVVSAPSYRDVDRMLRDSGSSALSGGSVSVYSRIAGSTARLHGVTHSDPACVVDVTASAQNSIEAGLAVARTVRRSQ